MVICSSFTKSIVGEEKKPKLSLELARKHEGTSAAASLCEEPNPFNKQLVSASQSL